jgi:iron complex outermembrane receptor protein
MKGSPFLPSNCVVSKSYIASLLATNAAFGMPDYANLSAVCPGSILGLFLFPAPTEADLPNGGRGFYADLSGHSLPNQPKWTQSISVDYALPLSGGWKATCTATSTTSRSPGPASTRTRSTSCTAGTTSTCA